MATVRIFDHAKWGISRGKFGPLSQGGRGAGPISQFSYCWWNFNGFGLVVFAAYCKSLE